MLFVFEGTVDELKETIKCKAKELGKEIVVYDNEPSRLEIGFMRLGHSGGRFFIADVTEENDRVILKGETKDIYENQNVGEIGRICSEASSYLLGYVFLEIPLLLLWLMIKDIVGIWVPLVLPVIYLVIRRLLNRKEDEKLDKEFAEFMALCTAYTSSEQHWDDVYKKLDLAGGMLQSICDDDQDMLVITYEDGMYIDVGYIEEEKTYYITVVEQETMEAWNNPLGVFSTCDKSRLPNELQKAIHTFRSI